MKRSHRIDLPTALDPPEHCRSRHGKGWVLERTPPKTTKARAYKAGWNRATSDNECLEQKKEGGRESNQCLYVTVKGSFDAHHMAYDMLQLKTFCGRTLTLPVAFGLLACSWLQALQFPFAGSRPLPLNGRYVSCVKYCSRQ
eukprot:1719246-Amphidinium_carterae.1